MRLVIGTLVITVGAVIAGPIQVRAQTTGGEERPAHIRTSASVTVTVPADLATVRFEVEATGKTPYQAGQRAAERANAIRAAIRSKGVAHDSLTTTDRGWWGYRSRIERRHGRDTTYTSRAGMTLEVRDLSRVGPAIDTALAEGAQTVSDVQFDATETADAHRRALARASRLARSKAETMAQAAGGRLGRLIELSTEKPLGYERSSSPAFRLMPLQAGAGDAGTTIVAPEIDVGVTVYGTWFFVPEG